MKNNYAQFLDNKTHIGGNDGFEPRFMPDFLFDFQRHLVEWNLIKGRSATFADCGLGKTPMQLVWADNVHRHTGKPTLILTPLAVSYQTEQEAKKFGIEAARSNNGKAKSPIVITNYERLHHFSTDDFGGCVADESSILKNFDGKTKALVTEFMRTLRYRLLCTATAAPNDYIELGTSSEALGGMGYMDMLSRFFKNDQNSNHPNRLWSGNGKWRFRGHAERDFWRWVCSWARAVRKPSDLGFDDGKFKLPPLVLNEHLIEADSLPEGYLINPVAVSLAEQRAERRRTLRQRCELAASLAISHAGSSLSWCNLNDEGDLLEELIPDAIQISGSDPDDKKEEAFIAFARGELKKLVSKSSIAGMGLNFQVCNHQTYFPSHSFEEWYQAVRRSWRFGQERPVTIDMIGSDGAAAEIANLKRKAKNAEEMFARLVELMQNELKITKHNPYTKKPALPKWLS